MFKNLSLKRFMINLNKTQAVNKEVYKMSEWNNDYEEFNEPIEKVEESSNVVNEEVLLSEAIPVMNRDVEEKPKKKRQVGKVIALTAVVALASFGGGSLYTSYQWMEKYGTPSITEQESNTTHNQNTIIPTAISNGGVSISDVAQKAADSVVEITTEVVSTDQFFGQFVTQGAGSGVVLSEDGYIITNNHVIDGAKKITVRLTNGNEYTAKLIGTDSQTDVAVIKIDTQGEKLQAAELGDSDKLIVGEPAIAIGNPLGELGGTVTNGIISALDREITISGRSMRLLQTNAAINPGNSGGGLFNGQGQLVGLVVAKSSGSDVEGLGFAIPVNKVKEISESLVKNGYVSGRPALGVKVVDVSSWQVAMQYNLNQTGVYVAELTEGGNAAAAGLKVGDFIVGIEDTQVASTSDISNIISNNKVGDIVKVTVSRNGKFVNVSLKLSELKPVQETVTDN